MIGTLDDPSLVKVDIHMFADEAFSWVTYPEDHVVYAKHRINEDGGCPNFCVNGVKGH